MDTHTEPYGRRFSHRHSLAASLAFGLAVSITIGAAVLSHRTSTAQPRPALPAAAAAPHANPLEGSWRLHGFFRELENGGARFTELGDHPNGYISFLADGRMSVIIVGTRLMHPVSASFSDQQKAELQRSTIAYAGSYRMEPEGKLLSYVDTTWDGQSSAGQHVMAFALSYDRKVLVLKTEPTRSPGDGRVTRGILVLEK